MGKNERERGKEERWQGCKSVGRNERERGKEDRGQKGWGKAGKDKREKGNEVQVQARVKSTGNAQKGKRVGGGNIN